jgi:hypothetical protein
MFLASINSGCNGYGEPVFRSHPREETDEPIDRPRRRIHLSGPFRGATGAQDRRGISKSDAV